MKGNAETWIGFVSADETLAADSVYTGRIINPEGKREEANEINEGQCRNMDRLCKRR